MNFVSKVLKRNKRNYIFFICRYLMCRINVFIYNYSKFNSYDKLEFSLAFFAYNLSHTLLFLIKLKLKWNSSFRMHLYLDWGSKRRSIMDKAFTAKEVKVDMNHIASSIWHTSITWCFPYNISLSLFVTSDHSNCLKKVA